MSQIGNSPEEFGSCKRKKKSHSHIKLKKAKSSKREKKRFKINTAQSDIHTECDYEYKPHIANSTYSTAEYGPSSISTNEMYGPAPPAHLLKNMGGPKEKTSLTDISESLNDSGTDPNTFYENAETPIGPVPICESHIMTEGQLELEKRALDIKYSAIQRNEFSEKELLSREEWMMKLPEIKKFGSILPTNRKFQTKDGPDFSDRSCWTDTPQKKLKKNEDLKKVDSALHIRKKDDEQDCFVKKQKNIKSRDKSLLEIHRKILRKQTEKSGASQKQQRQAFRREVDMQINRFDKAHTNSIIRKAQLFDKRFTTGDAKYL